MCLRSTVVHAARTASHTSSSNASPLGIHRHSNHRRLRGESRCPSAPRRCRRRRSFPPALSARTSSAFMRLKSTPWSRSISRTVNPLETAPVSRKCTHPLGRASRRTPLRRVLHQFQSRVLRDESSRTRHTLGDHRPRRISLVIALVDDPFHRDVRLHLAESREGRFRGRRRVR